MSQKKGKFFNGVILGGLLGAASYYLFGTKEGKKTQKKIKDESGKIVKKAKDSSQKIEKQAGQIVDKAKKSGKKVETKAKKLIAKAEKVVKKTHNKKDQTKKEK